MTNAKKTVPVIAAAFAAAVTLGGAVQTAQAAVHETAAVTVVIVDEDGRVAAPIPVDELEPTDGQIFWHNNGFCRTNVGC